MPAPYSIDLRSKVIAAIDRGEKKSHVSRMFNISRDTIDRWLNRCEATGSVQAVQGYQRGHTHRIKDWEEFRTFAQRYGDKTQAEMAQLWLGEMSERTSVSCFGTHWLDSKKKTYGYRERDEDKRAAFIAQLAAIPRSQQVYVDESGMDERDDYGYGWCERGQRFEALKSGRRTGRVNMMAAYCEQRLSAPFTVEGSCNRVVFETWLETCLVPTLQPRQVVILDNATFHHGGRIAELTLVGWMSHFVSTCLFSRLESD